MGFRLGTFQTLGERLGRIEALKKAWEIANVSPLDIPGVRGAVKKALPKPLEGPAQFALGQVNPLNAGLIAAGIAIPPLGVLGAAGRTTSIGARIAPELRVAGTSLLGAYAGQQAGQLAERELGIPGAGLIGSLAGGVGGAAYGIRGLTRSLAPGMAEFPLTHAGDVEGIVKSGGLMSREQRGGVTRGLGPPMTVTISTGTIARNAKIIERETARMQIMARGSDEQVSKLLVELQKESPSAFNGVFWHSVSTISPQSRVGSFKRYLYEREIAGGDLDPMFIGDPKEIIQGLYQGVPGVVQPTAVADTEKILTAQLVNKLNIWVNIMDEPAAQTLFKEWRNNPKTLKFLRKMFKTQDVDQAVDQWSRFTYSADVAAGSAPDLYYAVDRKVRFGVDDMAAAILERKPNRATQILRSSVKELDPPLVAASKLGLEYRIARVPGEPPIPISKVLSVSSKLPDETVIKMVEDVGYDNVPANVKGQYDELTMAGGETAFTNQPKSQLNQLRALRDQALAKAKALGFDPRSPRKPDETPEMTALREQFHNANKQVGDLKRQLAQQWAAELPPEFELARDKTAADALIAEGNALMAEGRNAQAAERYRQALGMVQGGGAGRIPPTIEGPGTFGEGFNLGPGGGPPPGGTQPPIGAGFEAPSKPLDIGEEIAAAANVPRVLLVSSLDISATARQLFPAWAGKPSLLPEIIARQAKSMVNPASSAAFNRSLLADNETQFGIAHGLDIVTAGTGATAEEAFQIARGAKVHRFLEKIPWIAATERAYTDAVNMARSTLFKDAIKNWSQEWMADPKKVQRLTSFINELTGRGDLKALNKYGPFLNSVLFSPRLLISRLKLPLRAVDLARPEMRGIVFKHLAGTFGFIAATAAMLTAVGITVEMDPRSANFMKARLGNMRVDLTGGFSPVYRYMAQIATGQRKTEAGDIIPAPRPDSMMRFLRSKLSPIAGLGYDISKGETFEGRELTVSGATAKEQLWNNLTPLVTQDIRDALENEGFLAGVGAGVGSFLGVGIQTYPETPQSKLQARFQEKYGKEYEAGVDNVLVEADPELFALAEESQRYKLERGQESAVAKEKRTREFAQREQDFNLPMLAEGVISGDPAAGSQFAEQFERYQQNIADVMYHEFFEAELEAGDTPLAQAFDTWRKITPEQYRDPATFEIDWEAYFNTKDEAFARLPLEYRNAIEARTRAQDPKVKQVEVQFKRARTLRRQYYDIPKWFPDIVSPEEQDIMVDIQRDAQVVNRELASRGYTDADASTIYGLVLKSGQYDQHLVGLAMALRPGTKYSQQYTNPDRQQFLLKNASILQLFYPELYRNEQLLAQLGGQGGNFTQAA